MFAGELFQFISESGDHAVQFVVSGWDASKAVSVSIAALSALASIYVKWRNSGYRLVDRLEEFLVAEEGKVGDCRKALSAISEIPRPGRRADAPTFVAKTLKRTITKMDWGFGSVALNDLHGAVYTMSRQARLSREQGDLHERKEMLAHLLLGAKAASRPHRTDEERVASRTEALGEFNKVLELDHRDPDALEYSGLMLLELSNAPTAIARFEKLLRIRRREKDQISIVRTRRLLATAYGKLPRPDWAAANRELTAALQELPDSHPLMRAQINEQQAAVRIKRRYFGAARDNLIAASTIYLSISNDSEGKAGMARVNDLETEIERLKATSAGILAPWTHVPVSVAGTIDSK